MTINCARCHDHKIDPIPQTDYYRMLAFFRGVKPYGYKRLDPANLSFFDKGTDKVIDPKFTQKLLIQRHKLELTVRKVEDKVRKAVTEAEKEDFAFEDNRIAILRKRPNILSLKQFEAYELALQTLRYVHSQNDALTARSLTVFGVSEFGSEAPPTHVMIRGNAHAPNNQVTPGYPSVLSFPEPEGIEPTLHATSGRRLTLANWIGSKKNPLTARVLVNRLWQHHFGRGIVETPNDFGFQGSRPTHPELLDWLAHEFMEGGWTLKRIHRLMLTSRTYGMSSVASE